MNYPVLKEARYYKSMESKTSDARKQCLEFEAKKNRAFATMEETAPHSIFVSYAFGMLNNEINFSTTPNSPNALRSTASGVPGCTSPKIYIR
ncbi:hypothetical protein BGAL_0062g00020 [Botrytis galanthina]|uniref:Uncharacterized protein n=1 Tax=Botrytis galanthina TaxID=278940 RepID=A0A4V4HVE8_9HELO|nr:hypothetical protein BGAL_0062g00020 [Botrytis galanthina]